jgi:hypothetical protein
MLEDFMLDMSGQCPQLIMVNERDPNTIYFGKIYLDVIIDHNNMVFLVEEVIEESGNSKWKKRMKNWKGKGKDKKDKKKNDAPTKAENEASAPPEQQMEEIR